jgi:ribulose-bisphosphate carboxylase large chain
MMQTPRDDSRIQAIYRVRCDANDIEARAQALAIEQSIEMPLPAVRSQRVRDEIVGRVEQITETAEGWQVRIGLATETVGNEAGQLLNMLFGNCSLQPDVELLDAELPDSLLAAFPGPAHGIDGLRAMTGAHGRALTCTALKPQGLAPDALAQLAGAFAGAGIDIIKDDHGIANQAYAPFAQRVEAVQRAVDAANKAIGGHCVYAPSISGGPSQLAQQLRDAHRAGVRAVLACPMLIGVPTFIELVREHGSMAVLAHPAYAGAARLAPALVLGKLFRLFGADATIFPNFGGRFSYSRETCLQVANAARLPLGNHKPALPVPAGGMRVERVDEMLAEFGTDSMLLIGGNLLEAGDALPQRTAEFVARVKGATQA